MGEEGEEDIKWLHGVARVKGKVGRVKGKVGRGEGEGKLGRRVNGRWRGEFKVGRGR